MELITNGSYIYIFSIIIMFLFARMAEGKLFEGEEIRTKGKSEF
ncbi:hypothetical protein [uncultured Ilyobacter sp.]|nr:hypothetical protein [uncultured Ilyobacter sp.]